MTGSFEDKIEALSVPYVRPNPHNSLLSKSSYSAGYLFRRIPFQLPVPATFPLQVPHHSFSAATSPFREIEGALLLLCYLRRQMNNELNFPQTSRGSFSAVSTPIFASKYSLELFEKKIEKKGTIEKRKYD